jgi:glycerophosphoryl diester phosphodiesterase
MAEFSYANQTLCFGHRGASQAAPENTLAAFQKARELGADGVELDVMLSRDDEAVVRHDYDLERTSNGHGLVRDHTLAELQALDAGSWFGPSFAGERIPTLRQVCAWAGQDMRLNVELKSVDVGDHGLEKRVVAIVHECGLERRVVFSSFNPFSIRRVKQIDASLHTGLLYAADLPIYLARVWLRPVARPDALHPEFHMVSAAYMGWAKTRSYRVNVWTPDEASDLQRLLALKVDSIITNRPDALVGLLKNSPA